MIVRNHELLNMNIRKAALVIICGVFLLLATTSPAFAKPADAESITTTLTTSLSAWTSGITGITYVASSGALTYTDCFPSGRSTYPFSGQPVQVTFWQYASGTWSVFGTYQMTTDSNGHYDTGWIRCGLVCLVVGVYAYYPRSGLYPAAYACAGQVPQCVL